MDKIEEYYTIDMANSTNIFWIVVSIFVPLGLYYVMYKLTLSVDKHVSHKKALYIMLKNEEIPKELKTSLRFFPTDTMKYYLFFLISGIITFIVEFEFPINFETLYIPTPTLIAFGVSFFFLIILSDVISQRLYVHQELEEEINRHVIKNPEKISFFKKRSGLGFLLLSFITFGVYVYLYLFLVTREYKLHIAADYSNVKKMIK